MSIRPLRNCRPLPQPLAQTRQGQSRLKAPKACVISTGALQVAPSSSLDCVKARA